MLERALRRRLRAEAMNGVWNAPPTASGDSRRAPSSRAIEPARDTDSASPAITVSSALFMLATHTSPSARRQAMSTVSESQPATTVITPGLASAAACMASPRSATSFTDSSKPMIPAAASDVYSPSEWPAVLVGTIPTRSTASRIARLSVNVAS